MGDRWEKERGGEIEREDSLLTSSMLGRGTRMARQRLLIGPMTLEVELQQRMRRQVDMYFSIVRRSACWASLVRRSTSVSNTTERERDNLGLT